MNNTEEIWKDIPNYEGYYQISDLGNIKSLDYNVITKNGVVKKHKGKVLSPGKNKNGYLYVILNNNTSQKTKTIHQLVAEAFLNHIPSKFNKVVNHKNFIKQDNRLENLEIVSHRENCNQKHIKSSSEYTGVCWDKSNKKWVCSIYFNRKAIKLGLFKSEIEAAECYQTALKAINDNNTDFIKLISNKHEKK